MTQLDCLTWNVHRCRGRDGVVDPGRTTDALLDLLRGAQADLVVLTEADEERPPHAGLLDLGRIGREAGLVSAQGDSALRWGPQSHGFLGTIVLHRPDLVPTGGHLLNLPGRYPRGATILTFRSGAQPFRIVATHLSLSQALRAAQMRAIGQYLARHPDMPTLLIGDLNEWRPWGGLALSRALVGRAFAGPARRSFPASLPLLTLDRIMATASARVTSAQVASSPELCGISDHLPLRARVRIG